MKKYPFNILLVTALTLYALTGWAATYGQTGFYDRKAEGWFWYAPEPQEAELEKKLEEPAPAVQQSSLAPPQDYQSGPHPFSSAWFRDNLPKYKDAAWDNPTVENLRAFLYLQRFAIDRSEQFSDTAELAVVGDPFLDEITRRPAATFAAQNVDREAGMAQSRLLKKVAQRAGIFFFFKSDCPYCELQAPFMKMLEYSEGFTIVPVSADGKGMSGDFFQNFKTDSGHVEKLGIQNYPAMFLVSQDGQFSPIGQGAMSLPELNHRLLIAARRNNWVTEAEFNSSRPVLDRDNNISEMLVSTGLEEGVKKLSESENKNGGYIPPNKLLEYIRAKLQEKRHVETN